MLVAQSDRRLLCIEPTGLLSASNVVLLFPFASAAWKADCYCNSDNSTHSRRSVGCFRTISDAATETGKDLAM